MSTITVTDLPAGNIATSADVNSTLVSWNTGTAAGQISRANVDMEAIDRRTMSGSAHVVATGEMGDNVIVTDSNLVGVNNPGVAYAILGALTTVDVAPSAHTTMIVNASVYAWNAAQVPAGPRLRIDMILQRSTNSGGTWANEIGTHQTFFMRDTGNCGGVNGIPGINVTATWQKYTNTAQPSIRYRVAYFTDLVSGLTFKFIGTIFVEMFGR